MFALGKKRQPEEQGFDGKSLKKMEGILEALERQLASSLGAVEEVEEQARKALAQCRREAEALQSAGVAPPALMAGLPSGVGTEPWPVPERVRAEQARREAVTARKAAVQAEERVLGQRRARSEELRWKARDAARALAAERGQLAERERARRQEEMQVATPPPGPAPVAPPDLGATVIRLPARSAAERRSAPRVELSTDVSLGTDSNFYTGFSSDLSEGGIFVATCTELEPGTEVDLAFRLPDGASIQCKGTVRWGRAFDERNPGLFPGVGVQFHDLAPVAKEAIRSFTAARDPMFFPD